MRHKKVVVVIGLLLASCVADQNESSRDPTPMDVERARDLAFLTLPPIRYQTREEFQAELSKEPEVGRRGSWPWIVATFGRLGFFPASCERDTAKKQELAFAGAAYSSETKTITIIKGNESSRSLYVHEHVHALQDQHFDLRAVHGSARTTDEAYAITALIEGDATLSASRYAYRFQLSRLWKPLRGAELAVASERSFNENDSVPPFFLAGSAFFYTYGTSYVANRAGVFDANSVAAREPRFTFGAIDQIFREALPRSTQEILSGGIEKCLETGDDFCPPKAPDPLVEDLGLNGLPRNITNRYKPKIVDRLGEWLIRVLGRKQEGAVSIATIARAWDGDQVVFLGKRTDADADPPSAVIWTSAWDDDASADAFRGFLVRLLSVAESPDEKNQYVPKDGEPLHIERSGNRVVMIKNLDGPPSDATEVARVALRNPVDGPLRVTNPLHLLLGSAGD